MHLDYIIISGLKKFNKPILNTVPVQFRFFQKAGVERDYLEMYQAKAGDLPSRIAV